MAEVILRGRALLAGTGIVVVIVLLAASLLAGPLAGGSSPTATPTPVVSVSPTPSPTETPSPSPSSTPAQTSTPSPTPLPSGMDYADLDGVLAPTDKAHRMPVAIMIDDNRVARPQSGFSSASIVYQAPADGGEDRYMMVFQEGTSSDIGPVRSARPYYVYWAAEYKAVFGHYGQDAKTLRQVLPAMSKYIYNMDALARHGCPYHRVSTRRMPHNAYTNTAAQIKCARKYGFPATYQGQPTRPFIEDTPLSDRPASQSIVVPYPTGTITYAFDRQTDTYLRSVGGRAQIDPANKKRVTARNIVVMFQAVSYYREPGHNSRPVVANVGSGKAIVFEEGRAIVGTWKKPSATALTRFYDSSGNEIPLVRGEIFIQSVPTKTAVTYK